MRAARRTETPVAGWLWDGTSFSTTPKHQLPTTNHYQFPTPKARDAASNWALAVGSGWELVVGRWELSGDNSEGRQLFHLSLSDLNRVISRAKRRQAEIDDDPGETGGIGTSADLDGHGDRLAVAIDHARRG